MRARSTGKVGSERLPRDKVKSTRHRMKARLSILNTMHESRAHNDRVMANVVLASALHEALPNSGTVGRVRHNDCNGCNGYNGMRERQTEGNETISPRRRCGGQNNIPALRK